MNKNIIGGFFLVLFLLVLLVGWTITKPKKETVVANDKISKKQEVKWGLCWQDHEEKRCGVVKTIVFHDPNGSKKIIKMKVYFPSTGVIVDFFRDPDCEVGIWVQHGSKKGTWTLFPTKTGYAGNAHGLKKWQAKLTVEEITVIR